MAVNTFDKLLSLNHGIGPGFDFLRVFLAVSIVAVHSFLLTGHRALFNDSPLWFLEYALVPMFFALSGFLITASAMRLSLKNFLINRGLRIVPALAVDVVICALIIGPLVSQVSLGEYFGDTRFAKYFLNIFGYIHYYLPGVYEGNPTHRVNGALWTVPYEILCYALSSFFIVFAWLRNQWKVAAFTGAMLLIGAIVGTTGVPASSPPRVFSMLDKLILSRESQIVVAFLIGVVSYQWRARIVYDKRIFLACLAICVLAALFPAVAKLNASRLVLLPSLVYMTVFIGLTPVPIPAYFKKGDYSYGIYLYHDPFLQMVIFLFPAMALSTLWGTAFTYLFGLSMVMVMSNLSWHFIEKPILALRKKFSFVARVRDLGETPPAEVPESGQLPFPPVHEPERP